MKESKFKPSELRLVARAEDYQRDGLGIGSRVCLNSGGPTMLVVDAEGDSRTVSWGDGRREETFSRMCLTNEVAL